MATFPAAARGRSRVVRPYGARACLRAPWLALWLLCALAVAGLVPPQRAAAQQASINVYRITPRDPDSGSLYVPSTFGSDARFALKVSVIGEYLRAPVVLRAGNANLVSGLAVTQFGVAGQFWKYLTLRFALPLIVDNQTTLPGAGAAKIADPVVSLGLWYPIEALGGLGVGVSGDIWLPLGDRASFLSDGSTGFSVTAQVGYEYDRFRLALSGGVRRRPSTAVYNTVLGTGAIVGGTLGVRALPWLSFTADIFGEIRDAQAGGSPVEATATAWFKPLDGLTVLLSGGGGLTSGLGTPQFRVTAGIAWTLDIENAARFFKNREAELAKNRDGEKRYLVKGDLTREEVVEDEADAPPEEPATETAQAKKPDVDTPASATPQAEAEKKAAEAARQAEADARLAALMEAPVPASFMRDSDYDGVADRVDRCPLMAEDDDRYLDSDGCPDLDDDGDGVPDAIDRCPRLNGGLDAPGGCPALMEAESVAAVAGKFVYRCGKTVYPDVPVRVNSDGKVRAFAPIHFRRGAELTPVGREQVRALACYLGRHPKMNLRVTGYSDSVGKPMAQAKVAHARAEIIVRELVRLGVKPNRVFLVDAENPSAKAGRVVGELGRRVELDLLEPVPVQSPTSERPSERDEVLSNSVRP
jgi:outer membrane protein OmpA-like peptidoglycan-associated protein